MRIIRAVLERKTPLIDLSDVVGRTFGVNSVPLTDDVKSMLGIDSAPLTEDVEKMFGIVSRAQPVFQNTPIEP